MRVAKFKDYASYQKWQVRGSQRVRDRPSACNKYEVENIATYFKKQRSQGPFNGICHGARCGTEISLFQGCFLDADIMGTDLAPVDKVSKKIVEWDFHKTKPEWKGKFDFLYSNSLDHSYKPFECAKEWMSQVHPNGFAFIMWTQLHVIHGLLPQSGGDCFSADLVDYIKLFDRYGVVKDLIYTADKRRPVVTLVVSPRT